MNLEEYKEINKTTSSEMFCSLMALLYQNIPCTKAIHRLRKKFKETRSQGSGGRKSVGLASPKFIKTVQSFVDQGGLSPRNKKDGDYFGTLANKVGNKGRTLSIK